MLQYRPRSRLKYLKIYFTFILQDLQQRYQEALAFLFYVLEEIDNILVIQLAQGTQIQAHVSPSLKPMPFLPDSIKKRPHLSFYSSQRITEKCTNIWETFFSFILGDYNYASLLFQSLKLSVICVLALFQMYSLF